jgi:hypothetical protein
MQVTDRFNLLPPSICIICEESPSGRVIDTLRQLKTGVASALNGRKYVCERCVGQFAGLLGYEQGEDVKQARIDVEFAQSALAHFRQRVAELAENFKTFAEHPGAAGEDTEFVVAGTPASAVVDGQARKPEVSEVFPPHPEIVGGSTKGVGRVADSETPAVASPAAASAASPGDVEDRQEEASEEDASDNSDEEVKPKSRSRSKKEDS